MNTKKLTISALLIAIGTVSAHIIYIPVGVAKCFPVQHIINVLSAVILGPFYAVSNAFVISLLRNILGTGSFLAFPGSMIGALVSSLVFKKTKNSLFTSIGEVFGTGVLGGISAYPVAKIMMGKEVGVFFFVIPFLLSTLGGSIIAFLMLEYMKKNKALNKIITWRLK